jgi:hypothetical protein
MTNPKTERPQADTIGIHAGLEKLLFLLALFLLSACSVAVPTLEELYPEGEHPSGIERVADPVQTLDPAAQAEETLQRLLATEKPQRDLIDLGKRYKGLGDDVELVVNAETPDYPLGTVHQFWVADDKNNSYYQINAVLRGKSEHLYMYVEEGVDVPRSGIDRTLSEFERTIYPRIRAYFGEEWSPGIDNDPRITVLNARIPGVGGYYSSADEFPSTVNPFSNEREMFYINVEDREFTAGTRWYLSTLCHELQHMVHWNINPSQDTWLNEGSSMVASVLCGYRVDGIVPWLFENADVQLTTWTDDSSAVVPHYAAAYLFMEYFAQQYGGYENLKDLITRPQTGRDSIDAYLESEGYAGDFDEVFANWVAANYIDDERPGNGSFYYDVRLPRLRPQQTVDDRTFDKDITVKQYGAKYINLRVPQGDYALEFTGASQVRLFPTTAPSGTHAWWSNRADMSATSLTRKVDLREAGEPVFRFSTWYDIEVDFDYVFVAVSTDDGRTWVTLPGTTTTTENPNGNNLGHGYTGKSGSGEAARWIEEEVSLAAFAGKEILLRFEYVTDDAYNSIGFLVDDLSISGTGFRDDAESDGDWEARGFFRTDGILPQNFIVQIVRYVDGLPSVERVMLLEQGEREVLFSLDRFGQELSNAVLIVSGATPVTTEIAHFNLRLSPVSGE